MNIFNRPNPEQQMQVAEGQKERDFGMQSTILGSSLHPADDQTYIAQQEMRTDLLKWQQDLFDEIEELKHRLRSEVKIDDRWQPKTMAVLDENGKQAYDDDGYGLLCKVPPLANEIFINLIDVQCNPFVSRNMINSNFKDGEIRNMLKYTMDDIADAMAENYEIYCIEFANFNLITRLIKNVIRPGPFRAIEGWTKKTDSTMAKRVEQYMDNPNAMKNNGKMWGLIQ